MRFHVISLPHTQTTKEYLPCAYTQKVLNFCRMMNSLGHEIFLYSGYENEAPCTEHIEIISKQKHEEFFSKNNWKKEFFAIEWDSKKPYWVEANNNAITEIKKRVKQKDFICLIGGNCQKPIADAFTNLSVEFGIGYEGVFSKFRVFESYAWMHYIYGRTKQANGNYYDVVIPNYFDKNDFYLSEKEDYALYIGRLISRKGVHIASQVCEKLGLKLKIAGQGATKIEGEYIYYPEGKVKGEYVGVVDVKKRAELMSKAKVVFCPTQYIGPFEGVHVEAMLSGTPVITTDWGCFSETFIEGVHGFRPRTFKEMLDSVKKCESLNPKEIREYAISRYDLDSVKYQYETYFKRLLDLWEEGWYQERDSS